MRLQHSFRDGRAGSGCFHGRNGACRVATNPFLDLLLRRTVWLGAVLVVALPAARGSSDLLGALPLWLVGMPLASWWALHRFRLPMRQASDDRDIATRQAGASRRRAGKPQARRWTGAARLRKGNVVHVA